MLAAHTVCSAVENFLRAFLRRRLEPSLRRRVEKPFKEHLMQGTLLYYYINLWFIYTNRPTKLILLFDKARLRLDLPTSQDPIVRSRLETCTQYSDTIGWSLFNDTVTWLRRLLSLVSRISVVVKLLYDQQNLALAVFSLAAQLFTVFGIKARWENTGMYMLRV